MIGQGPASVSQHYQQGVEILKEPKQPSKQMLSFREALSFKKHSLKYFLDKELFITMCVCSSWNQGPCKFFYIHQQSLGVL